MLRQKAECFFWYQPTRVIPEQKPLNGGCCCTTQVGTGRVTLMSFAVSKIVSASIENGFVMVNMTVRMALMNTTAVCSLSLVVYRIGYSVNSFEYSTYWNFSVWSTEVHGEISWVSVCLSECVGDFFLQMIFQD